jgi:hypothetical protein
MFSFYREAARWARSASQTVFTIVRLGVKKG